jgi:hypothetical protein
VVIVWAYGAVIFMLDCLSLISCEHVAYMSTHGFSVVDLRYRYRSISRYFRSDGFISDVSIFCYRYHFRAYDFHIVSEFKKYDRK